MSELERPRYEEQRRLGELGLRGAVQRFQESEERDPALVALGEAMGWAFSLRELQGKRVGADQLRLEEDDHPDGQAVAGLVYARNLIVHELGTVLQIVGDWGTFDWGTVPWGSSEMRWLPLDKMPPPERLDEHKKEWYQQCLAGNEIGPTLAAAERFLTEHLPGLPGHSTGAGI